MLCGFVILVGLSACGAAAEPSAAGSTSAAAPSVVASPTKTVSAAEALKAECATFNTAFESSIDRATNAGKLIIGAGSQPRRRQRASRISRRPIRRGSRR